MPRGIERKWNGVGRESSRGDKSNFNNRDESLDSLKIYLSLASGTFTVWNVISKMSNGHEELKRSLRRKNPDVSKIKKGGWGGRFRLGSNRVGWVFRRNAHVRTYVQRNWVDLDWIQSVLIPGAPSIASLTSSITFTYTHARTQRVLLSARPSHFRLLFVPCRNSTGYLSLSLGFRHIFCSLAQRNEGDLSKR